MYVNRLSPLLLISKKEARHKISLPFAHPIICCQKRSQNLLLPPPCYYILSACPTPGTHSREPIAITCSPTRFKVTQKIPDEHPTDKRLGPLGPSSNAGNFRLNGKSNLANCCLAKLTGHEHHRRSCVHCIRKMGKIDSGLTT